MTFYTVVPVSSVLFWLVDLYHAAGETRRQVQYITNFKKMSTFHNFVTIIRIAMRNASKYKYAYYYFSKLWKRRSVLRILRRKQIVALVKTNTFKLITCPWCHALLSNYTRTCCLILCKSIFKCVNTRFSVFYQC